jgi:hypothetical protein
VLLLLLLLQPSSLWLPSAADSVAALCGTKCTTGSWLNISPGSGSARQPDEESHLHSQQEQQHTLSMFGGKQGSTH